MLARECGHCSLSDKKETTTINERLISTNMKKKTITLPKWNIESVTGYKPKTTFWQDFSIADLFGAEAIKDTYERAKNEWLHNHVYITELVMVLNHKCWQHYDEGHSAISKLYTMLYNELDGLVAETLTGDELAYYYETID